MEHIPMSTVPDFDSIDWMKLARDKGLKINHHGPVQLSLLTTEERFEYSLKYAQELIEDNEKVLDSIRDDLDILIEQGQITTFDKASIVNQTMKILKEEGVDII